MNNHNQEQNGVENILQSLLTIQNTQGKKAKILLLKELLQEPNTNQCLRLAYNPLFNTHLGKAARKLTSDPLIGQDLSLETSYTLQTMGELQELMQDLGNGKIPRGHLALSLIWRLSQTVQSGELRSLLMDLLTCNLRLGINWNSFCIAAGIDRFKVTLAKDINKVKLKDKKFPIHPDTKKFVTAMYVQPKLDGYRCIAIHEDGEWKLYSRNGKEYENFPSIVEELEKHGDKECVYDGEIMSDDFQSMQRTAFAVKKKRTVGDVQYHVFDMLQDNEFSRQACYRTFYIRKNTLEAWHDFAWEQGMNKIIYVTTNRCKTWEEVYEKHAEFISQGYEGSIVRANTMYDFKRTDNLMKIKDMLSDDSVILGVTQGAGRHEGMLGALIVRQENGKRCLVGTGFSDKMRQEFWDKKETLTNRVTEIKYQELSPDGVMRFPVFMRFRDDK